MSAKDGRISSVGLFLAGSLLGAGVALLLAPQSGKKTRRDIRYLAEKAKNRSEAIQAELRYMAENWFEDISDRMEECVVRGRDWTEKTASEVQHALDSGKEYIQKEVEKIFRA